MKGFYRHLSSAASLPRAAELLADIELAALWSAGMRGIILDLDNTIVSEDDKWLSAQACNWVGAAKRAGFKLFLLSNGKRRQRVEYWSNYLQIPALAAARKPIPCAFHRALSHMQLAANRVVVIGDSFHTDIAGAWLVGCTAIQVASLPHPARVWEKYIGQIVHQPYPEHRQLLPLSPRPPLKSR